MTAQFIDVADIALARDTSGLLSVLEHLFPLKFHAGGARDHNDPIGRILGFVSSDTPESLAVDRPTLAVPATTWRAGDDTIACTSICFADHLEVPWPYRGRSLAVRAELDARVHETLSSQRDRVLAADAEGRPIWTLDDHPPGRLYRTSLRLPQTPLDVDVGLATTEERFIQILPLFHFLREITGHQGFSNPPLRAAFIIDDPNLHWPSYGYVDYRIIAASAHRERYHVAFATIPLDAWWVHGKTAEIFRAHADALSLLIHGNNHSRHELAQNHSNEAIAALLLQAITRIRQLEVRSGLDVSRVMTPPHGACSSRVLAGLPRQGFESACISAGSLRAHNAGQAWTNRLGLAPSELVEGCPILPRWAFGGISDATLLAAAYLGQPLILRGHHQDLKNGLDLFRDFAAKINALGDVHWGSLGELSRLNYRHRIEGTMMYVQPLGTRITVKVPDGIDELRIETQGLDWHALQPETTLDGAATCNTFAAVAGVRTYDFARSPMPAIPVAYPSATSATLILRRILTETRDRLRFGSIGE